MDNVRFLWFVRVFICSGCSGKNVENLCKTLRKSLWVKCVLVTKSVQKKLHFFKNWGIVGVIHRLGGNLSRWFYTHIYLYKNPVFHIFHIAYYYYYYKFI